MVASAWSPHLQQVVGPPVSASRGSGGGQRLCAVGGSSIHKSKQKCFSNALGYTLVALEVL